MRDDLKPALNAVALLIALALLVVGISWGLEPSPACGDAPGRWIRWAVAVLAACSAAALVARRHRIGAVLLLASFSVFLASAYSARGCLS
ncbi:hypothetical protein OJ998_15605 [Solirubrobacter taibaiensis]|nr:hypothetical protein [Solirubrobacter taibaiensis]